MNSATEFEVADHRYADAVEFLADVQLFADRIEVKEGLGRVFGWAVTGIKHRNTACTGKFLD